MIDGWTKIMSRFGKIGARFWFKIWSFDLTKIGAQFGEIGE
jgi:hypothetical protein